jgi:non-homologous end joining protein Ku
LSLPIAANRSTHGTTDNGRVAWHFLGNVVSNAAADAIRPVQKEVSGVTKEELENVALESTRTIEIDEFVDRSEIDPATSAAWW